ncbi:MAG TPA: hypothetical protein VE685_21640, partial [Thermoanaerobaculia bacterium]|nr:hypothetical protein [Thermoanaerobaculia bacterium]
QEGAISLQIKQGEGEPLRIGFEELALLSPDREERLQALDSCLREIGPTGPDFSSLQRSARERELSEREASELLDALWNGVAGVQARLEARLEAGEATLWDLVPESLDYFERLCGPDPGNLVPEEYLSSVLPEYRKSLLRRDLRRGLELCLMGALRDDLCPGAWLEGTDDDELWQAMEACQPQLAPFSLLGALDVALYRQHDDRFRVFAENAVATLIKNQFPDAAKNDLYQFLPAFAQFNVNQINLLENGKLRAPFWKRMCAWMQANQVIRLLRPLGVNLDGLRTQLEMNLVAAGRYANLLDLQREPIYHASEFSSLALRCEVLRRLLHLKVRLSAAGRMVPGADEIEKAAARLAKESGLPLCWALPGPLEGHRRPVESENALVEDSKDALLKLSGDLLLSNMLTLSQIFHFDRDTMSYFREVIAKIDSEDGNFSPEERLVNAGFVAAAQRDSELAEAIAEAVFTRASGLQGPNPVVLGLQALVIASAAFEEENAWAAWLKEKLSEFAGRLPAGKASALLYHQLQELKKVTKLNLGVYSRAEALASAGAS